jgi:hypothetical protein
MALFKSDGLVHQPVSCLESARQLLAKYHQVCSATNDGKAPALAPDKPPRIAGKEQ